MTPRTSKHESGDPSIETAGRRDFLRRAGAGLGSIALASLTDVAGKVVKEILA